MASKTISLEVDAYERLRTAKREHESFSQTIRRIVPPVNKLAADLAARVKSEDWGRNVEWPRVEEGYRARRRRSAR